MSDQYKIFKGDDPYFVTFTVVDWLKVLLDDSYKMVLIGSIRYCQKNKELNVYGYCIMPNHVHMIIQAAGIFTISDILRDLKKFTAKAIVKKLEEEKPIGYKQYLDTFIDAGKPLKRIKTYKVWQDGNQAKLIFSNRFLLEKLAYIHNNPVEYGLCEVPWAYKFRSATNYAGMKSMLDVILLSL
jgi:putative transposase